MKKIRNITGLVLVMLLVFNGSCSKDFLDKKPLSTLSPENTFIDAAGLQTALDAALVGVFWQWNGDAENLHFNCMMSDIAVIGATDKQNTYVDMRTYATPQNMPHKDGGRNYYVYADDYSDIKNCNTVIDYIDIPEWPGGTSDPERNHLLGSAYFLRAFFYMQLTMDFGNIAFPLTLVTDARQDFKAFYMQGIWDQMIEDLEFAVKYMKPKSQLPRGQAPVDAAKILLAKYYMMNERFADAEALMTSVIDDNESWLFTQADVDASGIDSVMVGNNYNPFEERANELLPGPDCNQKADPINLLHMDKDAQRTSNPEGIWMFVNEPFLDGALGRSSSVRGWGPNYVSTKQGIVAPNMAKAMYTDQDDEPKLMLKWGRGQGFVRPTNYSQFDVWDFNGVEDLQDYRHKRGNWFFMDMLTYDNPELIGNEWYGQPLRLWDNGTLLCNDTIRCWFGYPMYKFWAPNRDSQVKRQDGGERDFYVLREAEAYLLRAEARFWQDNYQGAADDINIIRARANAILMYTASDVQNDGIGAILDERCRELYGEEYRHDELVRISVILAKTGKPCYNGHTYSWDGIDMEKSLSENNFYYDRMMEKNTFYRDNVPWVTYPAIAYTMDPKNIFWPVYEPYIIGNVGATLNQTDGYDGSERNIEPLTHIVQPAGMPNTDPMEAIGERK